MSKLSKILLAIILVLISILLCFGIYLYINNIPSTQIIRDSDIENSNIEKKLRENDVIELNLNQLKE